VHGLLQWNASERGQSAASPVTRGRIERGGTRRAQRRAHLPWPETQLQQRVRATAMCAGLREKRGQ
jgi:hypothetical protein